MWKKIWRLQKDKEAAQSELDSYKELFNNAVLLKKQAEELYTLLTPVNEQNTYRNSDNPEEKAKFDVAIYETALKAYNDACAKYSVSSYNELYTKSQQANNDYNTKAQAAEQKKVLPKAVSAHWKAEKLILNLK